MDAEKQKALDLALKQITKDFGKGAMIRLGDKEVEAIEAIPTGSIGLDLALGIGGVPKGRIIEVYGPESSGKTTLTLHIIAECQKAGGVCAFIDAEHALDVKYASNLGVDTDNLYVAQPDFGEQALDMVETLARSGAVDLIVIDSVAALTPKSEIEGDMGDQHVGLQARLMSQALRKLTGIVHKMGTTVIFINQIRMKIGATGYGTPETTTGGNVAPPFRVAEFDVMFGEGISREGEIIDYGVKLDVVDKSGAWFSYKAGKLGQGRENSKAYLKEHKDVADEIIATIKGSMGIASILSGGKDDDEQSDDKGEE